MIDITKQTAASTNNLVQAVTNMQNPNAVIHPVREEVQKPVQPSQVFTEAWSTAAATVVQGAAAQAASNAVRLMNEVPPKLPDVVAKCVEKTGAAFMKDVRKYARSVKAFDDAHDKYKIMAEDTLHKRYPPGTRPFSSSTTFVEPWSTSRGSTQTIALKVPAGTSRREAMRVLHHQATCQIKSIELEAMKERRDAMLRLANKETLHTRCRAAIAELVEKDADIRNLGIDSPDRISINEELVIQKLDEKYSQIVKKVLDEITKAEEKHNKDKQQQEKLNKEFTQQSPENILKNLVSHFVSEEVLKHNAQEDDPMNQEVGRDEEEENDSHPPQTSFDTQEAMSRLVQTFSGKDKGKGKGAGKQAPNKAQNAQAPKNGATPGAAPGNSTAMGHGKGWWASSNRSTAYNTASTSNGGKSKGKNKGKSKSKGKSKGKKGHHNKGQGGKKGGKKGKQYGGKK